MENLAYFIFAILPIFLIFLFMVVLRMKATHCMPLVYAVTALICLILWKMSLIVIIASFFKGLFIVIEILLIVFFAILLLMIYTQSKRIDTIKDFLSTISSDYRVLAVLLGWSFVCLIEGASGFGTPAAIVAPLLVSIGFTPFASVVIAIIGDSAPVTFGAAGTPINVGLGSLGFSADILQSVTLYSSIFHAVISIIVPFFIVYYAINLHKNSNARISIKDCIPLCIIAWLSFSIPFVLTAYLVGPELPSIIGGLFSILAVSICAKKKWLMPKKILQIKKRNNRKIPTKEIIISFLPYLFLIASLITIRLINPLFAYISKISISIPSLFGVSINYKFFPFVSPSFYFFITCIFALCIFRQKFRDICLECDLSLIKLKTAAISLAFTLGIVQLFIFSSINNSGLSSIPVLIAEILAGIFSHFYFFISPFLGMIGAFISGSNTVSNLLFGSLQAGTAAKLGFSVIGALVLQSVGGAIGNMIAIHNVLSASATVGLHDCEGDVIRKTIKPALIYSFMAGILGFILFVLLRIV